MFVSIANTIPGLRPLTSPGRFSITPLAKSGKTSGGSWTLHARSSQASRSPTVAARLPLRSLASESLSSPDHDHKNHLTLLHNHPCLYVLSSHHLHVYPSTYSPLPVSVTIINPPLSHVRILTVPFLSTFLTLSIYPSHNLV